MNFAIILSGGIGSRMNCKNMPKQYISVAGKPIIMHTLEVFEKCEHIKKIVIVAAEEWQEDIMKWSSISNIKKIQGFALPGKSRQESILNGLKACMKLGVDDSDNVVIHDAVRPLVECNLIEGCIIGLNGYDACMPVVAINDTVYYSENGENITSLLDRSKLFAGQSPEAFNLKKYYAIHDPFDSEGLEKIRGSSEIAFNSGLSIRIIDGDYRNFKITTQADLERYKRIMGE